MYMAIETTPRLCRDYANTSKIPSVQLQRDLSSDRYNCAKRGKEREVNPKWVQQNNSRGI
jgi:hypothetical protein